MKQLSSPLLLLLVDERILQLNEVVLFEYLVVRLLAHCLIGNHLSHLGELLDPSLVLLNFSLEVPNVVFFDQLIHNAPDLFLFLFLQLNLPLESLNATFHLQLIPRMLSQVIELRGPSKQRSVRRALSEVLVLTVRKALRDYPDRLEVLLGHCFRY